MKQHFVECCSLEVCPDLDTIKAADFSGFYCVSVCDLVGIRTQDPQLRRLLLYPAELRDQELCATCHRRWMMEGGSIAARIIAQSGHKGTIKMKNERMKNEKLLKEA